jgi:hypothetical protein
MRRLLASPLFDVVSATQILLAGWAAPCGWWTWVIAGFGGLALGKALRRMQRWIGP